MMQTAFLILAFASSAYAAAVADPTSTYSSESLVTVSTTHSPLKDFTYLLTFSETVQAGSGTMTFAETSGATTTVAVSCSKTTVDFNGKYIFVPVSTELKKASDYSVSIPSTCFKGTGGEMLAADKANGWGSSTFKTLGKPTGGTYITNDRVGPQLYSQPHASASPVSPYDAAWVTKDTSFVLYFREAVQAGEAAVTFTKTVPVGTLSATSGGGMTTTSTHQAITTAAASSAAIAYDTKFPGKITITPTEFELGAEYTMSIGTAAFKDAAGNFNPVNTLSVTYNVYVTTAISAYFPTNGDTTNVTKQTNIILDFAAPVTGGTGNGFYLCKGWAPDNFCFPSTTVSQSNIFYIGSKMIVNPGTDMTSGTQYNISMTADTVKYFSGITASTAGAWSYTFTVEASTGVDTGKPELITALIDCDADGTLAGETCDMDLDTLHDFVELSGSVSSTSPLSGSGATQPKYKLYFKERVAVSGSKTAKITADDGSVSSLAVTTSVDAGAKDCIATLAPSLSEGKLYTLSLASGVLTDDAPLKNPYLGTTFSFYSPLKSPTAVKPTNAATNIAKSTALKLTFGDTPRIGLTSGKSYLTITEGGTGAVQTLQLTDTDTTKIQDKDVVLLPSGLKAGKTYTVMVPKHSFRYLTVDYSYSFSTRAEDTMPPSTVISSPAGTQAKLALDPKVPYVLFSEKVTATAAKLITFKEDGTTKYTITATDSTCGATACVEISENKASFYPLGKSTGVAAAWATSGKTYTVEIDAGAFTDTTTTKVLANSIAATSYTFTVNADVAGPTVKSATPASPSSPAEQKVFVTFNEVIQNNGNVNAVAIKNWDFLGSSAAPSLLMTGTKQNGQRQTVTLTFDTAVQAGTGSISMFKYTDTSDGAAGVTTSSVAFAGSNVIFKPSTTIADSTSYYVKAAAGAITNAESTTTMADELNTKGTVLFTGPMTANYSYTEVWGPSGIYDVENSTDTTLPAPVWTTMDDYACTSANGVIPDIVIYMNEEIETADYTKMVKLYACAGGANGNCDTDGTPDDTLTWTDFPATSGSKPLLTADANQKFKFTLDLDGTGKAGSTSSYLTQLTKNMVFLESGMFQDYDNGLTADTRTSKAISLPFSVCETKFDTPGSDLLRVYTASALSTSSTATARKFQVLIPTGSIRDALGNSISSTGSYSFYQEGSAPTMDTSSSNPGNGQNANLKENIVLSFNEVVQAGAGKFQLWSRDTTDALAFEIDVAAVSGSSPTRTLATSGNNMMAGKSLSITPKALCTGTPSCAKLTHGTTYYLKTDRGGVIKDVIGNSLAAVNTRSSWYWVGKSNTDNSRPEVSFVGGYSTGSTTLVGYVFFSEQVAATTSASLSIIDCGSDLVCSATGDNVAAITDATVVYGDGTAGQDYGMMKFTKSVPTNNRRYKINLPSALVKDVIEAGSGLSTLDSNTVYSFYAAVGTIPTTSGGAAPVINNYSPAISSTVITTSTDIVLHFNEDVQSGTSGTLSLCLNSDADDDGTPKCTAGDLSDLNDATASYSAVTIDRRQVTIPLAKDLKIGQKLYVLMPPGFVRDATTSSTAVATVETSGYAFTVKDLDTIKPTLDWSTTTTVTSGSVTLYFSEAVQASSALGGANVTVYGTNADVYDISSTVSGNKVTIAKSSWTQGAKYYLDMSADSFTDLAGNTLSASIAGSSYEFTISSDTAISPALPTLVPTDETTTIDQYDVLSVKFEEVVQKGTGKISIYSGAGSMAGTTSGTILMESDIASLPLVSYAESGAVKNKLVIAPPGKMIAGGEYALRMPSTAVKDAAGNLFSLLDVMRTTTAQTYSTNGGWGFTVTTKKDYTAPSIAAAVIGAGGSPNPAFTSGNTITMYFSETVQLGTTGSVYLAGSTGGNLCSSGGACTTSSCTSACSFTAGTVTKTLSTLTLSGSKVTAVVPTLQAGSGYKLQIHKEKFKDVAGTLMAADVDGETDSAKYILKQVAAATDSTGPAHSTTGTPPALTAAYPTNGAKMVPPSSTVTIQFNENVQAGSGNINVGSVGVAVSDCTFSASTIVCDPAGDLGRNTLYSVSYSASVIKDAAGNTATSTIGSTNSKLEFTTIDLDYMAPTMTSVGGTSYAVRRLYKTPYDPANAAANVAKGTVVTMTFSETVQAGTGTLSIGTKTVDMGGTLTGSVYFSGSTAYVDICSSGLSAGATASVTTSQIGAFKDTSGQPLAHIASGYSFGVIADDTEAPTIYQYVPKIDTTTADDNPSTDITLYFSEAVQAAATKKVTVNGGSDVIIPVDNANPDKGSVTVSAQMVVIDPFDDFSYDKTVAVKAESGSFKDLYDNTFNGFTGATDYQFAIPAFAFTASRTSNASNTPLPLMDGAMAFWPNSSMMIIYGGGASCSNTLYTSTTGATWIEKTTSGPAVTYASSALDGSGCIWMMGGQCTGANTATIYKTCDGGLSWPALPIPSVVPSGTWPEAMSGHAIAIVGGWTLVVVDSVGGKVYTALDTAAATMKLVASTVPFASRKDPMLQATSDNKLYLMGGHNCNDATCSNNAAFTDVWMSTEVTTAGLTSEVGATWTCQTANYDAALTSTYTKGIGRYVSSVITLDDTLWLMGGHVPNTTTGLNTVYTSYAGPLDLSLATTVYAQYPLATATGLLKSTAVTMYFTEDVLAGTGTITVTDLGNDVTAGGTTANADAAITITTAFSRQMLTITPSAALKTSHKYTVALGDGSVKDLAGNTFTSFTSFDFTVTTDGAAPTFSSASPSGASVGPATNILLTTSEAVAKGTGAITVSCATGANYTADISTATIVTDKVFFPSPGLLTDGQLYTISAPAGLLVDLVGNSNAAAASIGTFTVLSGTTSSAADGYRGDMFAAAVAGSTNATADTTAPTFVSMYPPAGATDVPSSNTSATMFFSEPVKFNASGFISIVNSSSKVVASINLTKDVDVISTVYNGAKLDLGKVTGFTMAKGAAYTISVPAGILTDFAGNAVAAASKTFTTLAGTADTTAPSVLMTSPASGSTGNLGSMTTVSLWFSEDITPVSGSVTVKLGGTSLAMGVTSSNVTVSGSTLSATVFAGSMNSAGTWNVLVPAGSLKGSDGNHFTGVNDTGSFPSYYSFGVVAADAVKPTLTTADILPAKETAPTYTLGTSDSFKLVFSETVQAGTGAVSFKASYTSPTVVAPTSSEVFFSGTTAVVSPSSDLMAGEIYSMLIDGAAFTDVQGNAMAALTSGFTVSTAPIIKFAKVGTKHFDSYSFFNGERYGSAACVAPNNDVFMVGGKNGTAGSTAMLNDVWKLVTQRDINCASSYGAKTACSATTCTGGALGTSTATSTIWKIPSAGGLKCMSSSGAMTMMGQTVATRTENCPCPTCDTAPDGSLVANILDAGSYLTTYTPVSVGGTVDLKCGLGYTSNASSFSCVYSTPYAGVFATPYPTCDPEVTTTTVPTTAAPAPAPVVSSNVSTAAPTTTRVENVTTFTIKSALTLSFASLPENVTAASLAADTAFVSNVAGSIASGLGVDLSMITITKIELITARRLEDEQRRLQGVKLKIEYELVTTDASVATAVQETLSDPTKTSAFTDAFSAALVEKEAASGRTIAVAEISSEAPVVTSVTEVITITEPPPAAPGTPAETPAETAAPTPATPAGTPAPTPAPAKEEEEEESDNGAVIGGVVGGVVGLGVLGGAVYAFKKKSAQE